MLDDGRLSERERPKLHEDLDRLDRHITKEKANDRRRQQSVPSLVLVLQHAVGRHRREERDVAQQDRDPSLR